MMNRLNTGKGAENGTGQLQFVESIRVDRETRLHWKQALLALFWSLIFIKSVLAHWAISYWDMPIQSVWVWGPTIFAGIVCTIVFVAGPREETEV
jgi:hypothetical protein